MMAVDPFTTCHGALPDPPILALVGSSPPMVRLRSLLAEAALGTEPMILRGESGAGKTLAARIVFAQSPHCRSVVRLRCGRAGPDETCEKLFRLLQSSAKKENVCLLLDDFGDAPTWLQERVCTAVASASSVCPPRIVSTTARDLERLSAHGKLQGAFFRLTQGKMVWIPPLRVRRGDIREIVEHFLKPFPDASFDPDALEWLEAQAWPENVRQLRGVVRRLVLLHDHVTKAHIRQEFGGGRRRNN
jgi:two-component system, NtrC family, response regulator AtoC